MKIFSPPCENTQSTTIEDPGEIPSDVAISSRGAFALTYSSDTSQGEVSLILFAANATAPCATVYQPAMGPKD